MGVMPKYYKVHTDDCTVELEPIYTELVPMVHGKWIDIKMAHCDITECSVCGADFAMKYFSNAKYCPECGARMECEMTQLNQ